MSEAPDEPIRTGLPMVDSILVSLETAEALPLSAQVEAFERAHDQLRRALDAPSEPHTEAS